MLAKDVWEMLGASGEGARAVAVVAVAVAASSHDNGDGDGAIGWAFGGGDEASGK